MVRWIWLVSWGCAGAGAGGAGEGEGGDGGPGSPCDSVADCADGSTCLAYGDGPGTCTLECSVELDECGAEASCAGVGAASVSVCQPDDERPEDGEVPDEDSRPRLPCETDADCERFGSGVICAEWAGLRDCTSACERERDCTPPAMLGVTMDLLTCAPDEGAPERDACVPDEACFADPLSCVSGAPF